MSVATTHGKSCFWASRVLHASRTTTGNRSGEKVLGIGMGPLSFHLYRHVFVQPFLPLYPPRACAPSRAMLYALLRRSRCAYLRGAQSCVRRAECDAQHSCVACLNERGVTSSWRNMCDISVSSFSFIAHMAMSVRCIMTLTGTDRVFPCCSPCVSIPK